MFSKKKKPQEKFQEPVVVAEYRFFNDAEIEKSILESHGINAMILDSSLAMNSCYLKLVVKIDDYEAAKNILNKNKSI